MENYNDKIRRSINKWVEEGHEKGLDAQASLQKHVEQILMMYLSEENMVKIKLAMLLKVASADAYKMIALKKKHCTNTPSDDVAFNNLLMAESYDELCNMLIGDGKFLLYVLYASYQFYNMSIWGKMNAVKSLSDDDNDWLLDNYACHLQDIKSYDINVDFNIFTHYFRTMVQKQKVLFEDNVDSLIVDVGGFLRDYTLNDYNRAIRLLLEIGRIDYATTKYLIAKKPDDFDDLQSHIAYYETNNLEDIIFMLVHDQTFLTDALWSFVYTYIDHCYQDIELSEEIIACKEADAIAKKLILE